LLSVFAVSLAGQSSRLRLNTGKEIYQAGCVACHGPDGTGQSEDLAGFTRPDTFPDFTDCRTSTREPEVQWRAIVTNGGPARAFSQIMPSFKDFLTPDQIDKVVAHLRTFCRDRAWPKGDLNLPRALVTEKAFPEDETVVTSAVNVKGAPGVGSAVVYEKRIGARGQIEAQVPYNFTHETGSWSSGFGDVLIGYKYAVFHSMKTGSILSLLGEVAAPTGNPANSIGSGSTVFEASAAYGQLLPSNSFFQLHTGFELPAHTDILPNAYYLRTALGKTFATRGGLGRRWSPITEFVYDRNLVHGAQNNWDVVPQIQIPLSRRLHILGSVGVRVPVNHTANRHVQLMFYVLWDYVDGKLNKGW
jgi:mono/diheme cytochrome c family protein